ncbi:MAG: hypothetical protein IJ806_08370 [Ruminococcus sp.]|nr:hypothetical protein [Ruminococcus sp.]
MRKNKERLSHSVWTSEPVVKPRKSAWLDNANDQARQSGERAKAEASALGSSGTSEPLILAQHGSTPAQRQAQGDILAPLVRTGPEDSREQRPDERTGRRRRRREERYPEQPEFRSKTQITMKIPDKTYREYQVNAVNNDDSVRKTVDLEMPASKMLTERELMEREQAAVKARQEEEARAASSNYARSVIDDILGNINAEEEAKKAALGTISEQLEAGKQENEEVGQADALTDTAAEDNVKAEDRPEESPDEETSQLPGEEGTEEPEEQAVPQEETDTAEPAAVSLKKENVRVTPKLTPESEYDFADMISRVRADKKKRAADVAEEEPEKADGSEEEQAQETLTEPEKTDGTAEDTERTAPAEEAETEENAGSVENAAAAHETQKPTEGQGPRPVHKKKRLKRRKENKYHEMEFSFINSIMSLGLLFTVAVSLVVLERESGFIHSENRNLAEFPTFSVKSYFDGQFTKGITEYYTDTIPGRETFKKFGSEFSKHLGINTDDMVVKGSHKTAEKEELDEEKVAAITTVTANLQPKPSTTTTTRPGETTTTTTRVSEEVVELPEILDDGQWEGDVIVFGKGENVRAVAGYYGMFEYGKMYAETINKWKEELPDVNVYNMSIPTSSAYYLPKSFRDTVSDQKDNIDNIASELKGIINVDVFNDLAKHTDEYIYSRTDHHWQPRGAYYAGKVFADKAGIDYPDLKTYDEWKIEGFLGTMYAYSDYDSELAANPDTFIYYKPDNSYSVTYYDTDFTAPRSGDLFFDYAEGVYCYSAILDVDWEVAEIETDVKNGRTLVIFKDSFGNALVPFMTHGFEKIYVCDFRYFDNNAIDFCKKVGCTDLLFAISVTSCATEMHIQAINNCRVQDNVNPAITEVESAEVPEQAEYEGGETTASVSGGNDDL